MKRSVWVVLMVFTMGAALVFPVSHGSAFSLFGGYKSIKDVDGVVTIPLAKINDGKAHHYEYSKDDLTVKFFVVKSRDGVIRAAFDACDVCFPSKKGYSQDGDFMVCNNCRMRFHSTRINVVKGGCNPAPLDREVVGENLVIKVEDILPGSRFF